MSAQNMKHDHGPFDIIGDVHGCGTELHLLLEQLGYAPDENGTWRHGERRKAIFLGDLIDRGPLVVEVLKLAMKMVEAGSALCLSGNHEMKLLRKLHGRKVNTANGLAITLTQMQNEPWEWKKKLKKFLSELPSHCVLDNGDLVVAHAGLKESLHGSESGTAQSFALYGDTTGQTDEFGLPIRLNWAFDYRGQAMVVYGHTPVAEPVWLNHTINIDTGCVFGGKLTALRYPEREIISVPAAQVYVESPRPFV